MPTLHVDIKLGYSVDNTRTLLGEYSRGCKTKEVMYSPKIIFEPKEERYFDTTNSNAFIFLSDYFGSEAPFEVSVIKADNSVQVLGNCNILAFECKDVIAVKVVNTSENEVYRAHVVR